MVVSNHAKVSGGNSDTFLKVFYNINFALSVKLTRTWEMARYALPASLLLVSHQHTHFHDISIQGAEISLEMTKGPWDDQLHHI